MGFLSPVMPRRFDVLRWRLDPRMQRVRVLVQHWGEFGFGAPWAVHLLYLVKIGGYVGGGLCFIVATPGVGSLDGLALWGTAPVVFQKALIWTLLFEVAGFGCGFGPLTLRFLPPMGGLLYWLRLGTTRLPPWPRLPLTGGSTRTLVDVLLYLALLAAAVWALLSPATRLQASLSASVYTVDPARLVPLAVLVPLIGLRDKTIFLAARAEHLWVALLTFLLPFLDMIVALKLLMVVIWWGAATSKLNRLFPYAVSVMLSNSPVLPKIVKRRLYRRFPVDMRPSGLARGLAHAGTLVEFVAPLVMLLSTNRTLTAAAVLAMVAFHLHILAALPVGAPLEWNVFMIFSLLYLFWGHLPHHLATATQPWLLAASTFVLVSLVVAGNLRPDKVSFLVAMRYYAGNWATSMWALQPSAIAKIDALVVKPCRFAKSQLRSLFGEQVAEVLVHQAYTFRAMHPHGRALFALLPRAAGAGHEDVFVLEGELVAGTVLGWNFGEGHLHGDQLIAALHRRCEFEPGEVRVVLLEARPLGSDRQQYRLADAATGEVERGHVMVADLMSRQPWEIENLLVHPDGASSGRHRRPGPG